jgi:glucokinase
MGRHCSLDDKIRFHFQAKCKTAKIVIAATGQILADGVLFTDSEWIVANEEMRASVR